MDISTKEELAEALEWAAENWDIANGRYGFSNPDEECPWEMKEMDWDTIAQLALDKIAQRDKE